MCHADLGFCKRLVRIPPGDAYPSLNLAQAVAVCGYELRLAAEEAGAAVASAGPRRRPGRTAGERVGDDAAASSGEREALLAHLTQALDTIGFLSRQNPEHIVADLRGLFARAGLTRRDVRIWRGIARQMLWAARPR